MKIIMEKQSEKLPEAAKQTFKYCGYADKNRLEIGKSVGEIARKKQENSKK